MLRAIATGMRTSVRVVETGIGPSVSDAGPDGTGRRCRPRAAHFQWAERGVASAAIMEQIDQVPDLQTQLESLLHQVWTEEARWRQRWSPPERDDD